MERYRPKKIVVERSAEHLPLTRTIIERLQGVPLELVSEVKPGLSGSVAEPGTDPVETLLLCKNRGRFFEPCPGTKHYLCCGYTIANVAANCHLNCTYCILQAYLNNPLMVVYTNTGDLFEELNGVFDRNRQLIHRVGTGEFSDSLILDHLTSFSSLMVPYFGEKDNAFLELKTKTDCIENLAGLGHAGKTIVSWSVNAEPVIDREERLACSLESRLSAASRCQGWGYRVGLHFDPLIYYPGWEGDYHAAVEKIFQAVDPASLAWISLGCFRFMPRLKPVIIERYPGSRILCQEFIRGLDGKMRYFKPIRIEMYGRLSGWIREAAPETLIYLCMESREVWQKSLGFAPRSNQELRTMLDRACRAETG